MLDAPAVVGGEGHYIYLYLTDALIWKVRLQSLHKVDREWANTYKL